MPIHRTRLTLALCASAVATAAVTILSTAAPARADVPLGIYSLSTARDNPVTSKDERLANIRNYDFISGYTLRVSWNDLEPASGQYNFAVIDSAIQTLAPLGQGLSLEILAGDEPAYVLANASSTYIDHRGGVNPVPWDTFTQQRQAALYSALGSHVVQGAGAPHALNQDPTLKSIAAGAAGLNYGVRDLNGAIRSHPEYTQQRYIDAVVSGVSASAAAFPNDTTFLPFFAFTDNQPGEPVDEQIIDRLAPLYNGPGETKLDFFVENLSDNGPLPAPNGMGAGSNLADWVRLGGDTMMQPLDSWLGHPADRDAQLGSENPATGIQLAYDNYGTRFFELYITDIDGAVAGVLDAAGRPLLADLRQWSDTLTAPLADFNRDGKADAADLVLWRSGLGVTNATIALGDADNNQRVDGADFLHWQLQAGATVAATAPVPEGTAALLALQSLIALLMIAPFSRDAKVRRSGARGGRSSR
jgi:hypothetical protein